MLNRIIAAILLVFLGQAPGWARSFSDVTYSHGYPGYSQDDSKKTGTLHVEQEGVVYEGPKGGGFHIPYQSIREQSYESQSRTDKYSGFVVGGPNPIVLASTLGASLLGNMVAAAHPRKTSDHFYKIRYQGPDNTMHEVTFRVPSESVQRSLMDEVGAASRAQYHNVLMLQEDNIQPVSNPQAPPEPAIIGVP